ncbi:MAG: hypothetical protein FWE61_01575 [Micrococcales bacterium]|nr:hypothetical protein [Micrococcales bacterium]
MMMVFDAGAFIAAERNDRAAWTRVKAARARGEVPVTSTAVVSQVWRGDGRQANLARMVTAVDAIPLTDPVALAIGRLLAQSGTNDVVDAALVLTATDGDVIYTSDPSDIAHLAATLGLHVDVVPV